MLRTVRVEPRPSRIALAALTGVHLGAMVLMLSLDASLWARGLLCIGLLAVAAWQMRAAGWLGGRLPLAELVCDAGGCKVRRAGDSAADWQDAQLEPDYLVSGWMIIMNFRISGSRRCVPLLLLPDSAAPDQMRRLRALLQARKIQCRMPRGSGAMGDDRGLRSVSLRN